MILRVPTQLLLFGSFLLFDGMVQIVVDPASIWGLLAQLPVVVAFLYLVIFLANKQEKRETAWLAHVEAQNVLWRQFIHDEHQNTITFMSEERARRVEGMTRIAEELKQNTALITAGNAILSQHDAITREKVIHESRS